jgi:hypothetical protein
LHFASRSSRLGSQLHTRMEASKPPISFDEDGRVRVLDAATYKQTEELEKEARAFVQSE